MAEFNNDEIANAICSASLVRNGKAAVPAAKSPVQWHVLAVLCLGEPGKRQKLGWNDGEVYEEKDTTNPRHQLLFPLQSPKPKYIPSQSRHNIHCCAHFTSANKCSSMPCYAVNIVTSVRLCLPDLSVDTFLMWSLMIHLHCCFAASPSTATW